MKKELPTGMVAAVIVVVILVIGIVGYTLNGRKGGQLNEGEQKQAQQTAADQYKQFGPGPGRKGGGSPMGGK